MKGILTVFMQKLAFICSMMTFSYQCVSGACTPIVELKRLLNYQGDEK